MAAGSGKTSAEMKTLRECEVSGVVLRLLETKTGCSGIVITNGRITGRIDGNDPDGIWRQLQDEATKTRPGYFGFDGAKARFLSSFPRGFELGAYFKYERQYKLDAKVKAERLLPLGDALTGKGLGSAASSLFQATNLLSQFEKIRVREALKGPQADAFVRAAARFANGDTEDGLAGMQNALRPHDAVKWTVLTYLPFLWRPEAHMFLKPQVTLDFASRVGHRFANDYLPQLDVRVYESLLDLVATTWREIAELGPRDRIDVQSFIWVVGKYDGSNEEQPNLQAS